MLYFGIVCLALFLLWVVTDMTMKPPSRRNKVDTKTFPKGWDIYWALRTAPNNFSIVEAHNAMVDARYEDFTGYKREQLRRLEVITARSLPCECRQCLHGITDGHRPPLSISPNAHRYGSMGN